MGNTNTNILIKGVLFLLAWFYGLGVAFRNFLFETKVLKSERFHIPVISVGNLTVGGTGKTPMVEYLLGLLGSRGKVAMLSRGYKRKTSGFVLADGTVTAREIGDEPMQIYKKFPDVAVAVDGNRRRGIKKLLRTYGSSLYAVVLDDAYQHRYVTPMVNILLVDYNRPIYEDYLLPAGQLREPFGAKERARMVVVTKCPDDVKPIDLRVMTKRLELTPHQDLFFTSIVYHEPIGVFNNGLRMDNLEECQAIVMAGVEEPEPLLKKIQAQVSRASLIKFRDHHDFTEADLDRVLHEWEKLPKGACALFTTEKDASRLLSNNEIRKNKYADMRDHLFYVPIGIRFLFDKEEDFERKLSTYVKEMKF